MLIIGGDNLKERRYGGNFTDEWYTPLHSVEKMLEVFPPKEGDTILCPFDTEASNFVKTLKERGFNVIYGIRDFMTKDYEFDYLITNPPYSNKDEVIARCVELGKPSVLVLPIDVLGGVKRHEIYSNTNVGVFVPTRRIAFISEDGEKSKGAAHHSIFIKLNGDENTIQFECAS